MARRYRDGETPAELAEWFGISARTVRRFLAAAGVSEPRRQSLDAAAVVAAYRGGEPLRAISERFRVDDKTVLAMVRRAGVPMRMPRVSDQVRKQIVARHQEGARVADIASEMGVSRSTVYRALREE